MFVVHLMGRDCLASGELEYIVDLIKGFDLVKSATLACAAEIMLS